METRDMLAFLLVLGLSIQYCKTITTDMFGTKTIYEWIQPITASNIHEDDLMDVVIDNGTCSAIQITAVYRHGARYPSPKDIIHMDKLHEVSKSKIVSTHDAISNWTNPFAADEAMALSFAGEREHRALGSRIATRFLSLLTHDKSAPQFISSHKQRCIDSSINFNSGLRKVLNSSRLHNEVFTPSINDHLLRFFDSCPLFQKAVKLNVTAHRQTLLFENSQLVRNITTTISRKLFGGQYTLLAGKVSENSTLRRDNRDTRTWSCKESPQSNSHSDLKSRSDMVGIISSSLQISDQHWLKKQRSIQSSVRFNRGLQSILLDRISLNFTPQVDDHLLRFYDGCQLFQKSVLFNLTAHRQTLLFENGNLLRNISEGISRKLMNGSYLLNPEDVILMAKYCAYELGLYGASVWCDIFEDWQQPVFEYLIDLEKYWGWSYGNRINYEQSCPLISTIFHNMDKFVTVSPPADRYTARFLFGHAETILPLVTALGLFEDAVPLKADNFNSQTHRKFVVSKISPFAANVAFVVYKCDQTNPDQGPDFRIKVQVNEKDVHVPGYDGPLYPYQMLRNRLAHYVDHCDFENLCKLNPDQTAVG